MRCLEDEYFPGNLRIGGRMSRIVIQHRRGNAFGRRRAGSHAVRSHHRHRRAVRDELLDRHAGVIYVGPAIGPIVHDVMIVGNLNVVQVDGAELRHFRYQKIRVSLPACAARISWTSLALERSPVPGLIGRDHELLVDLWKSKIAICGGRGFALGPKRFRNQGRARGDARGLQEIPPGRVGCFVGSALWVVGWRL